MVHNSSIPITNCGSEYATKPLVKIHVLSPTSFEPQLENDRFMIYDRCPMTDVAMAISTDADTDADVADLDHLVTS